MPKSEHVSEQDLELYLTGRLPKGKDSALDTHLGECKPSVVKLSATDDSLCQVARIGATQAIHDGKERRREHRLGTNESAALQTLNPFSRESLDVRILDVSKSGGRLHVVTGVMPGSLVKVRMKDDVAFGDARNCVPTTEGFYLGVELHDYFAAVDPRR